MELPGGYIAQRRVGRLLQKAIGGGRILAGGEQDRSDAPFLLEIHGARTEKAFVEKGGAAEESLFNLLASKGELEEEDKDFFFALFILNDPEVGDTFNRAWNRMKILGENFSRRQKVFQRLIELDPLPDAVVGTANPNRRKTLLDFFSHHFPEYFNHYTKVCLDYFEGKGSYPRGNPTIRCRDFFRYTKSLVSDKLYLRYSALKKKGVVVD